MNFVFVGPCGVGKSTVSKTYSHRADLLYLDFDELGMIDMQNRKGQTSPFSPTFLDFPKNLPDIISRHNSKGFVLDIGGDTVFRKKVDNLSRLKQVIWIKDNYNSRIIVLTAIKEALFKRYIPIKKRTEDDFYREWNDWLNIAEPYWRKCGDIFIDTSFLSVSEVLEQINETGVESS